VNTEPEGRPSIDDAPPPPPEVEQAALLGHLDDAVNLYVKFTGVDRDTARAVVEKFAAEH
jgi:hypothetical protein